MCLISRLKISTIEFLCTRTLSEVNSQRFCNLRGLSMAQGLQTSSPEEAFVTYL